MTFFVRFTVLVLLGYKVVLGVIVLPPEDCIWRLQNSNGSIDIPGQVPGGVYTDLMNEGILTDGDFYYRYNDFTYRWVSYDNWIYTTSFQASPQLLSNAKIALDFEGLDTVCEVYLNGVFVGSSDNMFVRYLFDATSVIQAESNLLELRFQSPVVYAQEIYDQQALDYIVPPECVDPAFRGECHANHIRKMQASFSWDWGPAFPNMAVWKDWRVVGWNDLIIHDVLFSASPEDIFPSLPDPNFSPSWNVTVAIWFDSVASVGSVDVELDISIDGKKYVTGIKTIEIAGHTSTSINFIIPENTVQMWWPNGYGSQYLYRLLVTTITPAGDSSFKSLNIGFRTVSLDQSYINETDTDKGRHYRIIVNNVPLFMKGSNWIPAHVLPEMVSTQYTRRLLEAAKDTHQNCIRVWGGGIYESDQFYEIADELGLLIWQDLMFACSMYPVKTTFLDTVKFEMQTQIRRLQYHPSILLYGTARDFERYKSDYIALYVDDIRNVVLSEDQSRDFVVSSPSNGIESELEGYIAVNPYSQFYGDTHFYQYLQDGWDWRIYPKTRFASEYGFQSWPSFIIFKNATTDEDWVRDSDMMDHRQHHPLGNTELDYQISMHMFLDEFPDNLPTFAQYLYMSQIHQSMAIKTESEFYRRGMSLLEQDGRGYTMGALYWQLNDIWQGASWASLVLIFQMKVTAVSDLTNDVENVTLEVALRSYRQFAPLKTLSVELLSLKNLSSETIAEFDLWEDLTIGDLCAYQMYNASDVCFLTMSLKDKENKNVAPDNFYLLGEPKNAPLKKALVQVTQITTLDDATFDFVVTSDNVALFVWLEVGVDGRFSDNGFLMDVPSKVVQFISLASTTVQELQASLNITTLTDTYNVGAAFRQRQGENHIGNINYF